MTACAQAARRPALAGSLCGLAVWCRPDAMLGLLALGVLLAIGPRKMPMRFASASLATVGSGLILAYLWFGRLMPETLHAKRLQAAWLPGIWPSGFSFWPAFVKQVEFNWLGPFTLAFIVGGVIGSALLVRIGGLTSRVMVIWASCIVIAYPLLGVGFYPWYGLLPLIVVIMGFFVSVGWVVRRCLAFSSPAFVGRTLASVVAVVLLVPVVGMSGIRTWNVFRHGIAPIHTEIYQKVGYFLREHMASGEKIAAIEVGVIGYYSERAVYDLLGLVSPEALPHVASGDLAGSFREGAPAAFVYYSPHRGLLDQITQQPWFEAEYCRWTVFEQGSTDDVLTVYRRCTVPLSAPAAEVGSS
jgi:hypothetical protein